MDLTSLARIERNFALFQTFRLTNQQEKLRANGISRFFTRSGKTKKEDPSPDTIESKNDFSNVSVKRERDEADDAEKANLRDAKKL